MHLNIEPPDELAAMVKVQASAQGLSVDGYVQRVLASTVAAPQESGRQPAAPFETGYGMLAKYAPAPSEDEIDDNRRDILRNFAQDF